MAMRTLSVHGKEELQYFIAIHLGKRSLTILGEHIIQGMHRYPVSELDLKQ